MSNTAAVLGGHGKLVKDIGSTVGMRFAALPISFVASIVLARSLQPSGKGAYTTVMTLGELAVVVGGLGVSTASVYYLAREQGRAAAHVRRVVVGLSLAIGAAVSLFLVAVAVASASVGLSAAVTWALIALCPLGVLSLTRGAFESFLRAQQLVRTINGVALLASAAFLVAVVAASIEGWLNPAGAVSLRVGVVGIAVLLLLMSVRRRGISVGRPSLEPGAARSLLLYGLPYASYSIVQNFSNRIDYFLVGAFDDSAAVGVYSIAVAQAELLWIVPTAVGFVLFPRVAARSRDADGSQGDETAALVRWTVLVTVLGAGLLAALADPITTLVYGNAFAGAVVPLRVLLIGVAAFALAQVLSGFLLGSGRLRPLVLLSGAGFLCNLGANLVLIPHFGITGAAAASAISYSVVGLGCAAVAGRRHPELAASALIPRPSLLLADVRRLMAQRHGQEPEAR